MNVTVENIVLGGVDHIDIDGSDFPISDSGCVIEKVADMGITNVVGRHRPRIVERTSHYTVTVSMLENTLEMLHLAWNLPNAISWSYGGTHNYLFLGIWQAEGGKNLASALTTHEIIVRGWGGLDSAGTERTWREWYFRKAVSYEYGEQDLSVGNTVYIPVRFYCYPDSTQAAGEEFGWVRELI